MRIIQLKFLLIGLIFLPQLGIAQSYYLFGDKTIGGSQSEWGGSIHLLNNNRMIIGGVSSSGVSGDKTVPLCDSLFSQENDLWVLEIDSAYNIYWQTALGGNRSKSQAAFELSNNKSEIFFGCSSRSDSSCTKSENNRSFPQSIADYWVGVLDNSGNLFWERTLGGTSTERDGRMIELSTGEYIVGGTSASTVSGDKTVVNFGSYDYWLVKLDSFGNKIWDKVFGGTGQESGQSDSFSLLPLTNGDFILGGTTGSPASGTISDTSRGQNDIWITKIDSSGNQIWDRRYGGSSSEWLFHLNTTADNGFIIAGSTVSPQGGEVSDTSRGLGDMWIVKLDSLGYKMWDKRFGGSLWDDARWIEQDFDGGYWIGGRTKSGFEGDLSENAYGPNDYWILKVDSLGNKIWDKRFGGPGDNWFNSFVLLPDSSIMLFGSADSGISTVKTDPGKGIHNFWLVHFKYGNSPVGLNEISQNNLVSIYPNPVDDWISISSRYDFKVTYFMLYDAIGKLVIRCDIGTFAKVNLSAVKPALYFYEVHDEKGNKVYGKLLKQ